MKDSVLYIDDEFINLELFYINFSDKFEVFRAESGKEGLEILAKNKGIKVVITDYKMPGMNGLEFIEKAKPVYPETKFSILTGYDIFEEIQQAIDKGYVENYFSKPFDLEKLEKAITTMNNS